MNSELHDSYARQNSEQTVALEDTFSIVRYQQFARILPFIEGRILDVGCAEGRGGQAFSEVKPSVGISGLDCVKDRLDNLPSCYTSSILGLTTAIPALDRSFDAVLARSTFLVYTDTLLVALYRNAASL